MIYRTEVISLVEVGQPSPHHKHFNEIPNDELRMKMLDFLKERTNESQVKFVTYQQKKSKYYNSKVKTKLFRLNNLVLRIVFLYIKEPWIGILGPIWEGPCRIKEEVQLGTYKM